MLILFSLENGSFLYADSEAVALTGTTSGLSFPAGHLEKLRNGAEAVETDLLELTGLGIDEKNNRPLCARLAKTGNSKIIEVVSSGKSGHFPEWLDHRLCSDSNLLNLIFESESYLVTILDHSGNIVSINEAALKALDYKPEELIGKNIVGLLHKKEELDYFRKKIYRKHPELKLDDFSALVYDAEQKQLDLKVCNYVKKDGTELRINLSIFPIVEPDSSVKGFAEVALDLSNFLETENRLLMSEKTMSTIVDCAVDAIVMINESGIIIGFNKAAEKTFRMPSSKAIGQNVKIFIPEPHRSRHDDYLKRYLKTGIAHIVGIGRKEFALRADGEKFPIDLAVGEVVLDEKRIFTGFVRDLTESVRLENERNSFFQMSLDLFCILDSNGNIKNTNARWFELLGYTTDEIYGQNLAKFFYVENPAESGQLLEDILGASELTGKSFRFKCADGSYKWILWNSTRNEALQVVFGVGRDVTVQHQILEELKQAKAQAEKLSDARGMFIARMSHELRTPLNSIIGFSTILQKNVTGSLTEKDLLYIGRIKKNGTTLLRLINGILDYSKTTSGFGEPENEPVHVDELIREIVDLMQVAFEEKRTRIELHIPTHVSVIHTDEVKLRQILQNLIDNALKFSEEGVVRVKLIIDELTRRPVRIEVHDSGPGIEPENLDLIFDAFQQVDNTVTRRWGGAGLGLAIAKSFAQLLGFRIEVDSAPGKGSCFSVILNSGKGESLE